MIDWIKTFLIPQDDKNVVKIRINNPYYEKEYLTKMVDYLDHKALMVRAGLEDLSPTDIFALEILGNTCCYNPEDYKEWRENRRAGELDNAEAES